MDKEKLYFIKQYFYKDGEYTMFWGELIYKEKPEKHTIDQSERVDIHLTIYTTLEECKSTYNKLLQAVKLE